MSKFSILEYCFSSNEEFAKEQGFELVDPSYFYTEKRFQSLQRIKNKEKADKKSAKSEALKNDESKQGTQKKKSTPASSKKDTQAAKSAPKQNSGKSGNRGG